MFYAQMTLISHLMVRSGPNNEYHFEPIKGNRMIWLILETCCFYVYMIAAMVYIAVRQCQSCCRNSIKESDMKKVTTDFILYSSNNLTWFAFNFVLITMPPLCWLMDAFSLDKPGATQSYLPILLTLRGMHIIAFAV